MGLAVPTSLLPAALLLFAGLILSLTRAPLARTLGLIGRAFGALIAVIQMAFMVDEGVTREWPRAMQVLWVVAMIYGMLFGILSLLRLDKDDEEVSRKLQNGVFAAAGIVILLFLIAADLESRSIITVDRVFWIR